MNFKRAIKDWVKYITPQIIIIICLISLNQCKSDSLDEIAPQRPPYIYEIPESVDGGWETAHLDNVAMKMQPIQALFENHLARRFKKQHSVLIVKDGKLVVEEYFKGYDLYSQYTQFNLNRKHYMASVSKSIISALIGISIDHSLINDTDEKLSVFFPDHNDQFIGGKEQTSIEDALTMQTGIRWDHPDQAHIMMSQSSYVDYVLDQPMDSIPGEKFQYSDGVTVLLGAVVAHVSGITLLHHLSIGIFLKPVIWHVLVNFISIKAFMKGNKSFLQNGWSNLLKIRWRRLDMLIIGGVMILMLMDNLLKHLLLVETEGR